VIDLKTRLTLRLAEAFSDKEQARMVASNAGLSLLNIKFDDSAAVTCTSVVEQAVLQKKIASLIEAALHYYPDDEIFREAAGALSRDPRAFDLPPWRAPQQVWITVLVLVGGIVVIDVLHLSLFAKGAIGVVLLAFSFPLVLRFFSPDEAASGATPSTQAAATIDLDSGMWGGLAGGLITGALLSVVYHTYADPKVSMSTLLPLVTAFFGIGVATLGCLVAVITWWFARLAQRRSKAGWLFNELTASLLAGLIAGVVSGAPIGWHFGSFKDQWAFAGPRILIAGILPGCYIVGVFIALWDQKLVARHRTRLIVWTSALASCVVGTLGAVISEGMGLHDRFYHLLYDEGTVAARISGGVIYGVLIGALAGLVIGIPILFSRVVPNLTSATRKGDQPAETPSAA